MIQINMRMKRLTHVLHLFSMKHVFEVNAAFLSRQKKERKKNLDSSNYLGDTKFNE